MTTTPLRIGFLVKTFPRLSETFILNEILGLEQLGWELHIYSLRRPVEEPVHPGVSQVVAPVSYIPALLPTASWMDPLLTVSANLRMLIKRPLRYVSAFRKYFFETKETRLKEFVQASCLAVSLEKQGITYLHAHFANTPTAVAEIVHWLTGIPFSFTAHAKDIYTTNEADLARRIQTATTVLTCTSANERHLRALCTDPVSIHLAYHGIDTARFAAVECESTQKAEVPLILSVGRFCEKKGLEDLIRACAILRDKSVTFRCTLVGYGPHEKKLKELRATLGLEDLIEMPGRLVQQDVIAQYSKASVFALPCLITDNGDRDGIPNVLFEAMAAAVPVVTTNVSGITELVVVGSTGWLVESRRPDILAETIEHVLSHPDEAARLAANAKRRVLHEFTLKMSAQRVHLQLQSAVNSATGEQEMERGVKRVSQETNA